MASELWTGDATTTDEFLALIDVEGVPRADLILSTKYCGRSRTWIHGILAIDLAQWLSVRMRVLYVTAVCQAMDQASDYDRAIHWQKMRAVWREMCERANTMSQQLGPCRPPLALFPPVRAPSNNVVAFRK